MGAVWDWLMGVTGQTAAVNDWWKKNQWWVYCIVALIIAVLIAYIWRSFK